MSDQPVKKSPRLRVVDMPSSTSSSSRRPSRSAPSTSSSPASSKGGRGPMGTDGKPRRKGEKDFERQTHAVRTSEERKRWDEATSGITSVHGRPFAPDRKYTDGDVVLHKKLGLGIVLSVEDDMSGMRVLFRDGEEQLELTPEN